jgi:hypothetical protein
MKISKAQVVLLKLIPINGNIVPLMDRYKLSFTDIALMLDKLESLKLITSKEVLKPTSFGIVTDVKIELTAKGKIVQHYYNNKKLMKIK